MNDKLSDLQRRTLLRSETAKEMKMRGCSYEEAFSSVLITHPEWRGTDPPRLAGEHPHRNAQMVNADGDTADDAAGRTERIQKLVREYCQQLGLDPDNASDYERAFRRVLTENPEISNAMHLPGKTPVNLWGKLGTGAGHTPPSKYPQGGTNQLPLSPPERAARLSR